MASNSDPISTAEAIRQCCLLNGNYVRSPELRQPDGSYLMWIQVNPSTADEPQEMSFLRRDFGWVRVEPGRYQHAVFGPELYIPLSLDQR